MRFTVSYKLNKLELSYRMRVYSLIKEAVRVANKEYYHRLFAYSDNKPKPFSFSCYLHKFSIHDTIIHLEQITITISSPDMEFAVHAINGLRHLETYQVGEEVWVQSNFRLQNESTIINRKVIFQTLSPILIEDKNGKPLSPMDSNYETELNYFANLQVKQFAKRDLFEPLRFLPIKMRKVVIQEKNRHLKPGTLLYFTTYRGKFLLEGNPQDLQLLYQLGLGKRTAYFGLLEHGGEEV